MASVVLQSIIIVINYVIDYKGPVIVIVINYLK